MKRKLSSATAFALLIMGLTMLIAPRITNHIGEQKAHSTIELFKSLKSKATSDEPIENEDNCIESGEMFDSVVHVDFDRLYTDSVAYNEKLKNHQTELLVSEWSYQNPSLDLCDYGITSGVYGYISAPSIGMELPIYLGGNDDNMALGAAHMTYTSLPIGGKSTNCVLTGHSGYIGRIFFDYVPSLNIGDEITVENYWETLTYKVIKKRILKKDESTDCYITDGRDLLTLITCISSGHGDFDRFYLICERK